MIHIHNFNIPGGFLRRVVPCVNKSLKEECIFLDAQGGLLQDEFVFDAGEQIQGSLIGGNKRLNLYISIQIRCIKFHLSNAKLPGGVTVLIATVLSAYMTP